MKLQIIFLKCTIQKTQHYKPIERFGGIEGFKSQQIRDNIKYEYATENEFNYLIIPYQIKKTVEIEKIITEKINEIKLNIV